MKQAIRWKGVVFDFDGTLLNSVQEGLSRFIRVAVGLGLEVDDCMVATIRNTWGVPGHILVSTCWPHISPETFIHEWETFDTRNPIELFPGVPGVLSVLAVLAPHFRLSLLTARGLSTHAQLRFHGIRQYFSFVCTHNDSPISKPHPESIKPLLEQYGQRGIELKDLVFVGDSVRMDYALARTLGMDFIAVTWGSNARSDFLAAGLDDAYIIDTLEELQKLLFS